MKRSHILLPFLSIHCWLLMLFGCQSAPANYITTTTLESTSSPTTLPITPMPNLITPFVQTAETTYPTPSVTTTTLAVVTPTTLSTLSYDEALVTVQTLYETNNGCLLPCWWGITPGKTTWEQTKDLLSPFVSQILEPLVPPSTSLWGVEVYIPGRMTPHKYMIYDDIITQISGFATQSSPLFYPSKVLETYHLPNEVWIRTSQDDGTEEIFPFSVSLFYQSQGFLLIYRTVDAWSEDNVIHGCVAVQEPEFVIWDPEEHLSYFELLARTTYKNDQDDIYAQPLESATRLTVEMFYEQFSDPNMPLCLETPSNLWPGGW